MTRYQRRLLLERVMFGLTALATATTLGVLFFLLGFLAYQGGSSLSWTFFTHLPTPVG
jgi:phosphate transport system permease protein